MTDVPATAEEQAYRRAFRVTLGAIAVLALAGALTGWLVAQGAGLVAALTGVLVAGFAGVTTQVAMLVGHRKSAEAMTAIVGGSWLAKMLIIVVAVLFLQGVENFHKPMFAVFVLAGIVATLAVDLWVLRKARVPYVSPGSN